MCDQCVCSAREVCQPVKGWKLVRALQDGLGPIRGDDYGLVDLDVDQDIEIVIPVEVTPVLPAMSWGDYLYREDAAMDESTDPAKSDKLEDENNDLMRRVCDFTARVRQVSSLDAWADLVASAREDGWDPKHDGHFSWWLYSRIANALANR